jgi:hypothetical protein
MTTSTRLSPTPRASVQRVEASAELKDLMRRLKLGRLLDTLPERLALARTQHLPHHEFLEMLFADEVTRRDHQAVLLRARAAHLDPSMVLDAWDDSTTVAFDRTLWAELCSLRFLTQANNVLSWGRWEWEKHSWPTPSGMPRSAANTRCTPNAPTNCSNGYAPPASITPTKRRCGNCTASNC